MGTRFLRFSHQNIRLYHTYIVFCKSIYKTLIKMDMVTRMVSERPVVIFSISSCSMCHTIKSLLLEFGVNPAVYELDEISKGREIEQALMRAGRNPIVPAVFIGGEFVGGANEIISLHLQRLLQPMLKNAGALWV